jgi:hypothetical protein
MFHTLFPPITPNHSYLGLNTTLIKYIFFSYVNPPVACEKSPNNSEFGYEISKLWLLVVLVRVEFDFPYFNSLTIVVQPLSYRSISLDQTLLTSRRNSELSRSLLSEPET